MDLETFWFCLIAVVWAMYFLLEGFDFGVGMLLPFVPRSDEERSTALRTIGPVWDGNEVWLVVAGGATFAAFPAWYATMFSGFYLALLLILVLPDHSGRLVRVALEERDSRLAVDVDVGEHDRQLRRVAALGHRAVVPRLRRPDRLRTATSPATSWTSSARTACSRESRSWRSSRSTGRRSSRSARRASCATAPRRAARKLAIPAAVLAAVYLAWTVAVAMDRNDKDLFPPVLPAALGIAALALAIVFLYTGRNGRAFAMTALGTISLVVTLFVSLYPRVMVSSTGFENSLTVDGAASSHYALQVMTRRGGDLRPARPPLPGVDVLRLPGASRWRADRNDVPGDHFYERGVGHMTPRIVILGGGFAGIGAARKLEDADADVVLIDKHDYHTFQPLLYQLATGLLETSAVGHSLRDLVQDQDNATVHKTNVTAVDLEAREVQLAEMAPLVYDYLVLGLGAEVNFFGTKGAAEHAFPMYTLPDAVRLKDHVLGRWEAADKDPSLIDDGALNVVVVGGGPTGVESAGALAELYRGDFAKDYPAVPQEKARVVLVEAGPELFSMFKPDIRAYTVDALEKRTVEVITGEAVESVSPTRVTLKSGTEIDAHTLVWGAGLQGNQLVQSLGLDLERGNRIGVGPELTVPDHPEVYAVGDIAAIRDAKTNQVLPQLGSVALQSGEHAGETIARRLAGKKTKPFKYRDKGTMATIGRGAAVVQMLGGRTMKGRTAQAAWGAVHLALLPTNEDRAKAVVDWAGAGFTHQRTGRITVETEKEE